MDQALKDLLERCKAGERSAQTALYNRLSSKVFSTALRYANGHDEALDIAQESWVKVFRHLTKFKEFNSFEGWVRRITVNTAITHYRRNLKHRYHDDVTETLATPADWEASKQAEFTMEEIQTAMAALPKGYRTVVQLYLVDGTLTKRSPRCWAWMSTLRRVSCRGQKAASGIPRSDVTSRHTKHGLAKC